MPPQQFNSAIRKNWCEAHKDILEQLLPADSPKIGEDINVKNISRQKFQADTINKMRERIEALETLNNQLYQHLCLLFENLPELILKTIQSNNKTNVKPEPLNGSAQKEITQMTITVKNNSQTFPTRREMDVLELLEKGYCAKEIAKELLISETTVITHKQNLKKKFKVKNTVELISKVRILK